MDTTLPLCSRVVMILEEFKSAGYEGPGLPPFYISDSGIWQYVPSKYGCPDITWMSNEFVFNR